jgi:hypothetical protein
MDVEKIRSSISTRVVNSSRMKLVNEDSVVLSTAKGLLVEYKIGRRNEVDGVYPEDR